MARPKQSTDKPIKATDTATISGIDAHIDHGDTFYNDKHPNLKAEHVPFNRPFNNSDWRTWKNRARKSRCRVDFGDNRERSPESSNVNRPDCRSNPSWSLRESLGQISGQWPCRAFRNRSTESGASRQLTWCAFWACGAANAD